MYRATIAEKIEWLFKHCYSAKPKHRDTINIQVKINVNSNNSCDYNFKPGKLLDEIKKFFVSKCGENKPTEQLSEHLQSKLHSIPWFEDWLDELCTYRKKLREEPTLVEQVQMLIANFNVAPPQKNEMVLVDRFDDSPYEYKLNGHTVLEKIASALFSEDANTRAQIPSWLKDELFQLEWTRAWFDRGVKRRNVARMRKLISKSMKLSVLLNMYSEAKPFWKECVDIVYDNSGNTFPFYVGTWLDDIVNNFTHGEEDNGRPAVVLDEGQKLAVRSLVWFDSWIASIVKNRQLRPLKRALMSDTETDCDEDGDGSVKMRKQTNV